jgi:4-hydroxy-tetrahydrodipicolinate reductase
MRIALIGYGKMGKEIEQQALAKGHQVTLRMDADNASSVTAEHLKQADVAIEFTSPFSAVSNIYKCFEAGIPVVCGTTGWMDQFEEVKSKCETEDQGFFYASNFSLGVNLFFILNKKLAQLMNPHDAYEAAITEIHHTQKLDAPSGTAITLAEGLIEHLDRKQKWECNGINDEKESLTFAPDNLRITALREDEVPGTHTITYTSDVDSIEITHTAFSRKGFAAGALMAAEWMAGRKGCFGMKDLFETFTNK